MVEKQDNLGDNLQFYCPLITLTPEHKNTSTDYQRSSEFVCIILSRDERERPAKKERKECHLNNYRDEVLLLLLVATAPTVTSAKVIIHTSCDQE